MAMKVLLLSGIKHFVFYHNTIQQLSVIKHQLGVCQHLAIGHVDCH
jgi:hypothetical protein